MRLSEHFSLAQLLASDTAARIGIDNAPPDEVLPQLRRLARGLDAVQLLLGSALTISSGYRSPALNRAVGGSPTSQHVLGMAADFTCPAYGSPARVAAAIQASDIAFDQCILEFNRWVHISFAEEPRGRVLSIYDSNSGYMDGLRDASGNPIT